MIENTISKDETPPVEKVRFPIKKIKKKKKNLRKSPESHHKIQGGATVFIVLLLSFLVAFLVGAFLFGFGIYILPMVVVGLILMGIGNLIALLVSFFMAFGNNRGDGAVGNFLAAASFVFIALLGFLNFAIGLGFLIWGLLAAIPFAWIVGIVLLALFLILLIFCILTAQEL